MPDYRYNILLTIVVSYSCEIIMFDNVTLTELFFSDKAIPIIKFQVVSVFLFVDILFSRIKNKVLRIFPEKKFDVVPPTFNPCNSKILYMNIRIFQTIWETVFTTMFDNAITKDYYFLCFALKWHPFLLSSWFDAH